MIAAKTNLEITAYREKFFLGLSLRQLACFAAAAALAVLTCFVCVQGLHWDMQVVSYLVMAEVLPFMGLGFIRRDGYPFEKLVKIYWAWHRENPQVPLRPYKECHNDKKKHIGIENIRERLTAMCGGTLTVDSVLGKGTTAVITIPKEEAI